MATKLLLKAYASGTTTADSVLSTIIPRAGRLVAIIAYASLTAAAAVTEGVLWEVSLQSSSQFTQTDASNVLAQIGAQSPSATAGSMDRRAVTITGLAVDIPAGARIYVHRTVSGSPSATVLNLIYVFE